MQFESATMIKVAIIVAVDKNGVIGKSGKMPWYIPDDLKRFKKITTPKPMIMGRKTFVSIGKPLPNRENIIISRDENLTIKGATVVNSVAQAIEVANQYCHQSNCDEIMIIGGSEIYELFLPITDRIYLTKIDQSYSGDTFFPPFDEKDWIVIEREEIHQNGSTPPYCNITFDRKK